MDAIDLPVLDLAPLLAAEAEGDTAAHAAAEAALADVHIKMLNLGFDWLHSLLPHVLAKVNRVHYGLLKPDEMVRMAASGTLPRSRGCDLSTVAAPLRK